MTKEELLKKIKKDAHALAYASENLRNDKEVVLEAVKKNGSTVCYAGGLKKR